MKKVWGKLRQDTKELWKFIGKTLFYFLIIVALLYLYSYSYTGGAHFVYNEF